MEGEVIIGYNARKEMEAILSWYMSWKEQERTVFLQTLKGLVTPQIDDLLGSFNSCKIQTDWSAPNVFTCQMKLLRDWFRLWDEIEKQHFLSRLSTHLNNQQLTFLSMAS